MAAARQVGSTIRRPGPGRAVPAITGALAVLLAACGPTPLPTTTAAPPATPAPATPATTATPLPAPSATPSAQPSASASPVVSPTAVDTSWSFVKREPCPESRFECVTLAVPSDHFTTGSEPWEVTFAIQRARGPRLGTFIMAAGGPGGSGISVADSYTDAYPARFTRRYDMVFPDQRGIGLSHPIGCPDASAAYFAGDVDPADPSEVGAVAAATRDFVAACLVEGGIPEAELPLYATSQVIHDLEAIREYLEVDELDLYGESYGTQLVQAYATAYPEHIRTLYLDGPVDLTLDGLSYYAEAARAFDDVLVGVLNACAARRACRADFEGQAPLAAYDTLQARLREAPIEFDFPLDDGTVERRTFSAGDLEDAVIGHLYGEYDRAMLVRALAASVDGNLVPLAHLAASALLVDPDTLESTHDPTWSDALYYAVECQDYGYGTGGGTDEERVREYLETARAMGVPSTRVPAVAYGDLPCVLWPNRPAVDARPDAIVDPPYPTWIMVATGDPITPPANALRLASRLRDVHVVMETGGPHVIFGWGKSCPDDIVADYLVDGTEPDEPVTICEGSIVDPYVRLARDTADAYPTSLALMRSLADQLLWTNDYAELIDEDPIATGCDYGGTVTYTPRANAAALELAGCELIDGLPLTGTGRLGYGGAVMLDVTVDGEPLRYQRRPNGDDSVRRGSSGDG